MRNYSFSNITNQESYGSRKNSNDLSQIYRHADTRTTDPSIRFDQIKKKYDTPSRVDVLKQSKDFQLQRQERRENTRESHHPLAGNSLKESFAVNRIQKNSFKFDAEVKDIVKERDYRRSNDKENDYESQKYACKEEETVILSKVREMKQSIINQEFSKPTFYPPTRSSVPSFTKQNYVDTRYDGKREFDPRVENIDKINFKIKQILSCLSENEKHQTNFREKEASAREEAYTSKDSACFGYKPKDGSGSKRNYDSYLNKESDRGSKPYIVDQKQTTVPQQSNRLTNKYDPYISKPAPAPAPAPDSQRFKSRDYSLNRVQIGSKDYSVSRPLKPEEQIVRTPTYLNKDLEARAASRSRSQIDSIKRSALVSDSVLKSGKKVNDEISRIQKKIEQFEQEKRKLNIQFTPFTLKNKSTANLNLSYSEKPERQSEDIRQSSQITGDSRNQSQNQQPSRFSANQRSSSNDLKFKSYLNRAADYSQKYGNFANKDRETSKSTICDNPRSKIVSQEDFELKIQNIKVKNIKVEDTPTQGTQDVTAGNQPEPSSSFDEEALKKRTDEGIEQRRKRRQSNAKESIISTETLKSIVSLFCEQVKLDENLRNLKIWLQSSQDSDKPTKISKALEAAGVQLPPEQCASLFAVDQSENNPFFSVQGFSGSFPALAKAYCSAQDHWKSSIQHKFDSSALLSEGFSSQKIDLQRKGFIELEDLVRFLNIQSGTFFRNRDLFLIFRRLTSSDRVEFDSILGEVCA